MINIVRINPQLLNMKSVKLFGFIFLLILASCTAKKVTEFENGIIKIKGCPEDGKCNIEQIKDSQISLQEDSTGELYPQIDKSNTYHLYKFTFDRDVEENIADAEHQEVIYFQIEKSKTFRELNDKALDRAKVIYGRHCRCPGENGYEAILSGSLYFETFRQVTEIRLQIKPEKLPISMKKVETNVTFYD